MNFNDFCSSLITLFHIMVVNNWFITTDMYTDVLGNAYPRVFFFSFIMITVWIMLNIVISFVLEIHSTVSEAVEEEN